MACIVMAYIAMAFMIMAYTNMAYIVIAYRCKRAFDTWQSLRKIELADDSTVYVKLPGIVVESIIPLAVVGGNVLQPHSGVLGCWGARLVACWGASELR